MDLLDDDAVPYKRDFFKTFYVDFCLGSLGSREYSSHIVSKASDDLKHQIQQIICLPKEALGLYFRSRLVEQINE